LDATVFAADLAGALRAVATPPRKASGEGPVELRFAWRAGAGANRVHAGRAAALHHAGEPALAGR
jgi:hypothetical protein